MRNYSQGNPDSIREMFGSIADRYDQANKWMSANRHKGWNKKFVATVTRGNFPKRYLDLCCGTGDIAYCLLNQAPHPCEAFLLDFCPEMLQCAESKAEQYAFKDHRINFIKGDAQNIPLPGESIDCVTVAYGIRNVKNPLQCAREAFRVLRDGGCFGILELTRPTHPLLKLGHSIYLKTILPIVGKYVTPNPGAYRYLCDSIQTFIPPNRLEGFLLEAGFRETAKKSLLGGVATILIGKKMKD